MASLDGHTTQRNMTAAAAFYEYIYHALLIHFTLTWSVQFNNIPQTHNKILIHTSADVPESMSLTSHMYITYLSVLTRTFSQIKRVHKTDRKILRIISNNNNLI